MKLRVTEPLRQHRLEHEARQRQWWPPDREAPRRERGGQGKRHVAPEHELDGTREVRDPYGNPTLEASLDERLAHDPWTIAAYRSHNHVVERTKALEREPLLRPSAVLAYLLHHPRRGYSPG